MEARQVFAFEEGNASMKALLGGKGANLAEMKSAGFPVPPGFTITTAACRSFLKLGERLSDALLNETASALRELETKTGLKLGDGKLPLLVSVRSGSVSSMPGMMDTILNLGLNDETVEGLAAATGDARFAYDCYRRLKTMFGQVVYGIEAVHFERLLHAVKKEEQVELDQDVSADGWKKLVTTFEDVYSRQAGKPFPQDVNEQLRQAIEAVFRSWNNPRAQVYRKINRIPDDQGTAVNIQQMVFGNKGDDCGTGVVFTRNPSTGEKGLFGEYLMNAQGEDVVAGIRTPLPIDSLNAVFPALYESLTEMANRLERHYRDMQDIEFTVERGTLYLLQTRNGKRTAQAAVKIAADLVAEKVIDAKEAIKRVEVSHLDRLLHRGIDESAIGTVVAVGLPASPGAASGRIAFDADTAEQWHREGTLVILVRPETMPEDIHGVLAAEGVLTSRGGLTSHAAVVARGMGKSCVCGCESISIDLDNKTMVAGGKTFAEGDWLTLDGATGRVVEGVVPLLDAKLTPELSQMLAWADDIRELRVYANADNGTDARVARSFGAEGIGLCRTEHMFLSPDRLPVVREMIMADNRALRDRALEKLLPMQQRDFEELFREMNGLPVTIRLLDPPLHEFLPDLEQLQHRLQQLNGGADEKSRDEKRELQRWIAKVKDLRESNPMLGHRGCRLGIVYPEIYDMQAEAIFRAAIVCAEEGVTVIPDIMIPLVGHDSELRLLRERIENIAAERLGDRGGDIPYRVGTMIEVPRAALTAAKIAKHADFFSFGTNDLTQMTLGYSRDDAEGKFLSAYLDQKLLPHNPFQVLDTEGVGQLIDWSVTAGKAQNPKLKTGICGEHGGDKDSILFCQRVGLDYVSCSPYRVPLARIAAAQAAILIEEESQGVIAEHSAAV